MATPHVAPPAEEPTQPVQSSAASETSDPWSVVTPLPQIVVHDGSDMKNMLIKGWNSTPSFQDEARLRDTVERMKYLNMSVLKKRHDDLGQASPSMYVDVQIAGLEAYFKMTEKIVRHMMPIHTFVQRVATLSWHVVADKIPLETAIEDYKGATEVFRKNTLISEVLDELKTVRNKIVVARKSLQNQKSQDGKHGGAMVGAGVCCLGISSFLGVASCCALNLPASAVAQCSCFSWMTITSSISHTTGGGFFTNPVTTSKVTTVLQPWASEGTCLSGMGTGVMGASVAKHGRDLRHERSEQCREAQETLEHIRKALAFLEQEWNGLRISCDFMIDYFSVSDAPKTMQMLCVECSPKLLQARDCIETFMVMMWIAKTLPVNIDGSIHNYIGTERFECIKSALESASSIASASP